VAARPLPLAPSADPMRRWARRGVAPWDTVQPGAALWAVQWAPQRAGAATDPPAGITKAPPEAIRDNEQPACRLLIYLPMRKLEYSRNQRELIIAGSWITDLETRWSHDDLASADCTETPH
jgi:hypothetical protein